MEITTLKGIITEIKQKKTPFSAAYPPIYARKLSFKVDMTAGNVPDPEILIIEKRKNEWVCKPSSVLLWGVTVITLDQPLPAGSADRFLHQQATYPLWISGPNTQHTWSCRRWGLPCRHCRQRRGALLPHRFTLTCAPKGHRRTILCGTFPRVAPGGR